MIGVVSMQYLFSPGESRLGVGQRWTTEWTEFQCENRLEAMKT